MVPDGPVVASGNDWTRNSFYGVLFGVFGVLGGRAHPWRSKTRRLS